MVRCGPFINRQTGIVIAIVIGARRAVMMVMFVVVPVMALVAGLNGWTLTGLACGGPAAAMIVMIMPQCGHRIGKQITCQYQPIQNSINPDHRCNPQKCQPCYLTSLG